MLTMRDFLENDHIRAQMPDLLRMAGEEELAAAFEEANRWGDLIANLGEQLEPVASTLERVAVDPSYDVIGSPIIDFATALRLYGPEGVRKGSPLEWTERSPNYYSAVDHRGTCWDIWPGTWGWGLVIANWDRPDWWVDSLEEAKALAEEVVARPSFKRPPRPGEIEVPFDD